MKPTIILLAIALTLVSVTTAFTGSSHGSVLRRDLVPEVYTGAMDNQRGEGFQLRRSLYKRGGNGGSDSGAYGSGPNTSGQVEPGQVDGGDYGGITPAYGDYSAPDGSGKNGAGSSGGEMVEKVISDKSLTRE